MMITRPTRMRRSAIMIALLTAVGAGCTPAGQAAAWTTAGQFETALAAHDDDAACRLLSDEASHRLETTSTRPCSAALDALSLPAGPIRSIETWGRQQPGPAGRVRPLPGRVPVGLAGDRSGLHTAYGSALRLCRGGLRCASSSSAP